MAKRRDIERRWHSPLWEAMTPAQRNEFKALADDPTKRIADVLAWCVENDLAASKSAVHRIMQRLAVEASIDRARDNAIAAKEITEAAERATAGDIAGAEDRPLKVLNQLVLDYACSGPVIRDSKDVTALANIVKATAAAKQVEIQRYKETVKRDAREQADKARALAGAATGSVREKLNALADGILSVGK